MNKNDVVAVRSGPGWRAWLFLLMGLLLAQGVLRVWAGVDLLMATGIEGQFGALVHWRIDDSFTGWAAVLALATVGPRGRFAWGDFSLLAVGLLVLVMATLLGDVGGRAQVEIGVAVVLGVGTFLVSVRQLTALARAARTVGLDLEQLWRGVTMQWALLWITAEIALRIKFWRDGIEAEPRARTLLFLIPMVGLMPNVMMALGLRWWNGWRGSPEKRPRLRAWLVAIAATNVGGILGVASLWLAPLAFAAAVFVILGICMFFVGFPREAWRETGALPLLLTAFLLLAAGLGMMAFDTAVERDLYSAAWRHLLSGTFLLWLVAMGTLAMNTVVNERLRARGAALAGALLLLLGILAAAGVLLAALQERSAIQGLFVGAVLQLGGIIVSAAAFLRSSRGLVGGRGG